VRPTLYDWGPTESQLSREHEVADHREDGLPGLYSMLGGKLASYRLFAEQMTDRLAVQLGVRAPCQTHVLSLPGGERRLDEVALAQEFLIDRWTARRLIFRHGARAERVLSPSRETPVLRRLVCACEAVTEAEVRFAVKNEWARNVDDVSRRTRLGLGPCGGMRCAVDCGRVVADELGASPEEGRSLAKDYISLNLRRRLPTLGPQQMRQEALAAAYLEAELGWVAGDSHQRQEA
jgi:glycerol-3-phosphate dehydrogenase